MRFSTPSRFVVRDQLRAAFRGDRDGRSFDGERIRRTVWFLKAAGAEAGLESRILKNLVRVAWERAAGRRATPWRAVVARMQRDDERRAKDEAKRAHEEAAGRVWKKKRYESTFSA